MTFTTSLKEEIAKNDFNILDSKFELLGFLNSVGKYSKDTMTVTIENASVIRKIYKQIKMIYNVNPSITVRTQKRFRVKQIYILTVKNKVKEIINDFKILDEYETDSEKIAFLQGTFLAVGNISNPQTSGYHLEYICKNIYIAEKIQKLLIYFGLNAKITDRGYKHIVYLKMSENISDLLKLFKATNSMFFFEDIRIYRDHKNMVNRLNNCELSNQTKTIDAGIKQLKDINYLEDNELTELLDDNTKMIIDARKKYPESSFNELSQILSIEYGYRIGKSGINHHFIKIANMVANHKKNNGEKNEN